MPNASDNCPTTPNPLQEDADSDDIGDECIHLLTTRDLELTMTTDNYRITASSPAKVTVTLTNTFPLAATGIDVGLTLSAELRVASATAEIGTWDGDTRRWHVDSLSKETAVTLELSVTTESTQGARGDLFAEILASDQPDPTSTPGNGNIWEDDAALISFGGSWDAALDFARSPDQHNAPTDTWQYYNARVPLATFLYTRYDRFTVGSCGEPTLQAWGPTAVQDGCYPYIGWRPDMAALGEIALQTPIRSTLDLGAGLPTLSWKSDFDGFVQITGHVRDAQPDGGNGVLVKLQKPGGATVRLWLSYFGTPAQADWSTGNNDDNTICGTCLDRIPVKAGDTIDVVTDDLGNPDFDLTGVALRIEPVQ